jgi:hypothetical protein
VTLTLKLLTILDAAAPASPTQDAPAATTPAIIYYFIFIKKLVKAGIFIGKYNVIQSGIINLKQLRLFIKNK